MCWCVFVLTKVHQSLDENRLPEREKNNQLDSQELVEGRVVLQVVSNREIEHDLLCARRFTGQKQVGGGELVHVFPMEQRADFHREPASPFFFPCFYQEIGRDRDRGRRQHQEPDISKLWAPTSLTIAPIDLQHNRQYRRQHIHRDVL